MKCVLLGFVVALGFASAAPGATINMIPSQAVYPVGDTVTITVTADSQGAAGTSAYAAFSYDPSILLAIPSRLPPVIIVPFVSPNGVLECGEGLCEAVDQSPVFPPFPYPRLRPTFSSPRFRSSRSRRAPRTWSGWSSTSSA
jgi:hypothetical protein